MVSVLHMLSYVGGLAGFLFVTLSLGLLWMAELIEEHSRYAKTVGMRAIYTIISLHVILYFSDSLPLIPTLFSIGCHLVYLQNFSSSWPYISLTSLRFLASCILVVADHFTWFFHFAQRAQEQKKYRGPKYRYGGAVRGTGYAAGEETFMDVAAFFGVCVWFVPLFLFLSLSANDHALPSLNASAPPSPRSINQTVDLASPADPPLPYRNKSNTSLVKSILTPVIDYLPRLGSSSKRRSDPEGIIAPRTPVRGSPLHTPVNMPNNYFPWSAPGSDESSGSTRNSSPGYQAQAQAQGTLGRGRPSRSGSGAGGVTPPPPRRVQSEMMTSGLNPRGIATRNGVPAVPDGLDEPEVTRRKSPMRSNTGVGAGTGAGGTGKAGPSMSLGPERGEVLGDREVVETRGIAQPKRKHD